MHTRPESRHVDLKTRHLSNPFAHKSQMKQCQIEQHHDGWRLVRGTCSGCVQSWRWSVLVSVRDADGLPLKSRNNGAVSTRLLFTSHRLSSHAGIDFNIPLQWPSIKHAPALLSTLLKLHCCHTSQWWASDIQPVAPFVSLLAPNQRTSFQRTLETLPKRCCFWSSLITATALLESILLTLTLCIWCSYKLNRQHESCKINASRWGPWSEIPLFKHIFQR